MKKLLLIVIALLVVGGGTAFALNHFHIVKLPKLSFAGSSPTTFTKGNSTLVTEAGITSNLQGTSHYIQMTVGFTVMDKALTKMGGKPGSNSGSGDAALDDEIDTNIILLSRQTPYADVTSSGGIQHFRQELQVLLTQIFGKGQVGTVYLPSVLTQ